MLVLGVLILPFCIVMFLQLFVPGGMPRPTLENYHIQSLHQ